MPTYSFSGGAIIPQDPGANTNVGDQTMQGTGGGLLTGTPQSPQTPQTSTPSDPSSSFNLLMMDLLKSAQGVGTADLLKRQRELQRESVGRTVAPTDESLRTLSPSQQSAIRSGNVSALSPDIDENAYQLKKAEQSLDSFFKIAQDAGKMSQEFAEKMVAPESVIANAKKIVESDPDKLSTILASFNDKSKQKLLESLDYAAMDRANAAKKAASGTGGNQAIDNERALFTSFRGEQIVKDFNSTLNKKLSVEGIVKSGVGGPGDLALVYEFMKALDPSSVVRETEYATAAASGNIFAGYMARFNGYLKENGGFLPPQVQKSFLSIIDTKYKVAKQQYDNAKSQYRELAKRQGLNPDNVVIGYEGAAPEEENRVEVISPDGTEGDVPESQLEEALSQGYKKK